MLPYKPTSEELDKLKEHIGRELTITVHVNEAYWDYGETEHNEYDVSYGIKLKEVSLDRIIGTILEYGANESEMKWHYRGRLITQPFSLRGSGSAPWEGELLKRVVLIESDNQILYDRRK